MRWSRNDNLASMLIRVLCGKPRKLINFIKKGCRRRYFGNCIPFFGFKPLDVQLWLGVFSPAQTAA